MGRPRKIPISPSQTRPFLEVKVSKQRQEEITFLKECLESKNLLPKYKEIAKAKLALLESDLNAS